MLRFFLLLVFLTPANLGAQSALNSLPEVEFSQLSQRDPNPLGEKALAIHPEQWKHGETEHFIYHFVHSYVATPVSVEAEFHYRVVVKELRNATRRAIPNRMSTFLRTRRIGSNSRRSGIWKSGRVEFIRREACSFSAIQSPDFPTTLLDTKSFTSSCTDSIRMVFRAGSAKDWRDTFPERVHQLSTCAGLPSRPHSQSIGIGDLISITALVAITHPPSDRVETFYDESERLVRFLATTDKRSFLAFLDALGRHQPFETALPRIYAGTLPIHPCSEERFRAYASRDSSPQQIDNE